MSEIHESAGEALPKGLVLGYITGAVGTSTRVKRVAGRATLIVGIVFLCITLGVVIFGGYNAYLISYELASMRVLMPMGPWIFGGPVPPAPPAPSLTWNDYWMGLRLAFRGAMPLWMVLSLVPGILLVTMAGAVGRGRRGPCITSAVCLFPSMAVVIFASAMFAVVAFLPGVPGPWRAIVVATPVGVVVILLLKDLCGFLFWIARNPITEKPAVEFISGKPKGA